ncbi:hypothetical protein LZD49_28625 [Dyadobacter sp. CY261]|uniref:hypothetical protein n=1 Tax=Dyadobacter sp. CY261 TaxID=2907203 RepID=UPI001F430209|nr:hypothetical protein [Dyadobacter sp. CY261]MCF0074484.1 hypothetical protein [Dyadobacter sp. CY261]
MGLKYFTRYRDSFGDTREVRFYTDGFDGEPVEWVNERAAVRFTSGASDSFFPEQPIIASQAHIGLILKERYNLREFVRNRKTFYVEIVNTSFDRIIWSGWLEPWDARHDYKKPPYVVNLTASCGLAHLSKKKYVNPNSTFKKTGLQIIQDCLGVIGRDSLPIRLSTHMYENGFTGDSKLGLNSFEENTFRYYDDNGEAMYCDVIVNNILNHFTAEIIQWNNMWVIRSVVDNATSLDTSYLDLSPSPHPLAWPSTFTINSSVAKSLDGGQMRILPPINKYRTEIDFGQQKPFFENGNMLLWSESGLIGWDFTHMAKGNPGWEQFGLGGEGSRSVLKINGKSPQPYRKKKKKKFWQVVVPILTGMVGANLKNTYQYIEPAEYIESPGGSISKADKSVTISFDYETEAFSSDILISIRIPVTRKNGDVVDYWVDPSSQPALAGADKSKASASEDFCLIRIPPVDMGKLTDKGTIDVSGNPNYPAANWTPGSKNTDWTWTVTGVPSGEYRRIGGPSGVLVENGDLVIARVPNLGGSQEAVGSSWEIIGIRNNVKKGTFSLGVSLNTTFITKPGEDFPADKIYVRFYKMADDEGKPGDWYKVYNLDGALEGFVASEESARYATTLERGDVTDEEAEPITLISGDFTPWYVGAWTRPGSNDVTSSWRRRPPLNESYSVYRAMMKDRLCMTTKALDVFEGKIQLLPGDLYLHYLHKLYFADQDKFFRIVRFSYDDSRKDADVTAIEILYEDIPDSELKQDSYIPGSRQLNTVPGQGDGIYPSKQDSTNGRLNAEDMPPTNEELEDRINAGSRTTPLFENFPPLVFIAGELGTDSVDLAEYLSEAILYNNADQEEEDQFDFNDLHWEVLQKPTWVISQTVVFMNVTATARPITPGSYSILFKVYDSNELEEEDEIDEETGEPIPKTLFFVEVEVPIVVYPKTKATYSLLEVSAGNASTVGSLPGSYPVPTRSDIQIGLVGPHDSVQFTLEGGGPTGKAIKQTVNPTISFTNSGVYRLFLEDNGQSLPAGIYRLYSYTAVNEKPVFIQDITFVLYDEEFLSKCGFFFTTGGTNVGPIDPAGTSKFPDPGAWDNKAIIADVEHDKAVIRLGKPDGSKIYEREVTHVDPVTDAEYFVYGTDQSRVIGRYTVGISLYLEGVEVMMRYADFETVKKTPESTGGQLQLLAKSATGVNFSVLATLPKTGVSAQTLPTPGWNLGSDAVSDPFDWEGDALAEYKGAKLIDVSMPTYVGRPSFIEYDFPVTFSDYRAFDNLSSVDIGNIHGNNKTFRYTRTRKLGGPSGEIVAIYQADFSFGTLVPIDEDAEVEEPGADIVDYKGRDAISEEVIDYVKHFDARVDDESVEIYLPNNPIFNHIQVKAKGIKYAHIQDMPAKSVLGNMGSSAGTPYAVSVKTLLADVVAGDLITIDVVNQILNGTSGYLPLTNVTKGSSVPVYSGDVNSYNFPGMALLSSGATNIPNATPGFLITGANGTNVGQLVISRSGDNSYYRGVTGGALGTWYQIASRTFTDATYVPLTRTVSTTTGLTGGAALSANLTLGLDFTYLDGRYATGTFQTLDWALVHSPNIGKFNSSGTNSPVPGTNYHGIFMPHATAGFGSAIAMRNGAMWFRSVESSVWGTWLQVADRTWANATFVPLTRTVSTGTGLLGGGALSANLSLTLDYTLLDARWSSTGISNLDWSTVHTDGKWKFNANSGNSPVSGTTTHGIFMPHPTAGFGSAIAFRNGEGFYRGLEGSVWAAWKQIADRAWVNAINVATGAGLIGGTTLGNPVTISMGTPSTLSNSTTNSASGTTHTHSITSANLIQGSNVVLSGSLTSRLLGSGDVTISVTAFPWPNITSKPITLAGFGIVDAPTIDYVNGALDGKENTFAKGSLIQGSNVSLSGTLTNRLVGSGDVTIAVTAVPWSIITGKPTTVSGYGIADGATLTDLSSGLAGKENTFSKGNIVVTNGIAASGTLTSRLVGSGDVTFGLGWSGVSAGTYRSVTVDIYGRVTAGTNPNTLSGYGLDSTVYTKSQVDALIAGAGGLTGSGAAGKVAIWGASNTLTESAIMYSGTQISINGHLVINGGSISVTPASLPATGSADGELYYSAGAYYYWHASSSAFKKIETL